ncbi:MAG TPA: cbb3-type cytochrome c oxidase subunit I [Chitinophagaceae bacterium]|jgi:nitric oxide reductase subunit B|nr:cbb3-type cytochrome c oxidase subunit I [Chitinophagaceae bacterium]
MTALTTQYATDKAAKAILILSMSYLLLGLLLGITGSLQYLYPEFLKEDLSFQKTRPLHVYLAITWIFTAAQGGLYYYIPRVAGRPCVWKQGVVIHFFMQLTLSVCIVICFFSGYFGGREYLEFPPLFGLLILISWLPLVINFFFTIRPKFGKAPVYIWSWSTGILFFFITLSESYLWLIDYFSSNIVRDITVQWKALGSMVGSWNMLVYGTAMYVMEKISGDTKIAQSKEAFFFYFLGLTNLMFNWGHHTYIVPAAPWVKMVAYIISMTELIIFGHIIWKWRKSVSAAVKNFQLASYRFLSFADGWIFLNITLALIMSVPAWNFYTHGTHITVAHAMGTTIGINTMLLLASIYLIAKTEIPLQFQKHKKKILAVSIIANISLLLFWISLIASGLVKISGNLKNLPFAQIMLNTKIWFQIFAASGFLLAMALMFLLFAGISCFSNRRNQLERN